jgi:hypothetical protein
VPASAETRKLRELILYIADRMERDDHAGQGRIKLAKLLWLSDFEAFRRFGKSITGARYVADELGPAPVDELLALRDLEGSGALVQEAGYDRQKLPRAQRPSDTTEFTEGELAVVNEMLDRYRAWTGSQLVDLAHEFPGYKIAKRGGEVPYPVSTGDPLNPPPQYEFADTPSFIESKAQLGLSESEIDDHMWAIENMLLDGPIQWSVPAGDDPEMRVAVSDSTAYSPVALRIVFFLDGRIIRRVRVGRR